MGRWRNGLAKHLFMKDIRNTHGDIFKRQGKFYQNIDTKVVISEHDYHFLSDTQKSKMIVHQYKTPYIKLIDLDFNINIL